MEKLDRPADPARPYQANTNPMINTASQGSARQLLHGFRLNGDDVDSPSDGVRQFLDVAAVAGHDRFVTT